MEPRPLCQRPTVRGAGDAAERHKTRRGMGSDDVRFIIEVPWTVIHVKHFLH